MSKKSKQSNEEIDIAALQEEGKGDFESRPIAFSKHPDDKNNFYGYRVKFTEEPRVLQSKKGNNYDVADGTLVEVVNDPDVEVGKEYTWILPHVLKKKLLKQGGSTITGKTFDWAGRGKREPTKGGRPYYDFGVMIKEGTLAWSVLTRCLPIRAEEDEELD